MINRRNALFGWLAWKVTKRVLKRKARGAVPAVDTDTKRPNRAAVVGAIAGLGAALWVLIRRKGDDAPPPPE